jgi:D-alanyl-D-alanine carboxypeptidase
MARISEKAAIKIMNKHLFVSVISAVILSATATAQNPARPPDTPAARQFVAFLAIYNQADRAAAEQFLSKNMPAMTADRMLAPRAQTGELEFSSTESSTPTQLRALVKAKGSGNTLRVITTVEAAEPYKITGLQIQPAQPQQAAAPTTGLTESETAAARQESAFKQFSAWLEAFNTGDRETYGKFLETIFPSRAAMLEAEMRLRQQTGGFDFKLLEQATPTQVTGLVQERGSDRFGRFTLTIEAAEPHRIASLGIRAISRPAEFPIARMTESEVIAAVREKIEKAAAMDAFSGAIVIAKNGKTLFSEAYGMADREKKVANSAETRFRIGSMNKMFTAVSIMQLVEAGKVKLNDPVGKYIRDYPNQDVATKVTIHNLLTHTGGTGDIFGPEFTAHRLELKTLNDYITLYGKRAPEFEAGSRWAYSNYGMLLLGVVIERVSGQSYYDYVDEHIYKVAGMTRSGSLPEDVAVPTRSVGYMRAQGGPGFVPNTDTLPYRGTSAGGGYSTAADLAKFADAVLNHKLLNAADTDLLTTGKVETGGTGGGKYAYGFEDSKEGGTRVIGHSGGAPGMSGDLRILPESGYVIAVVANLDAMSGPQITGFVTPRLPK